jgi:hypothetical protein
MTSYVPPSFDLEAFNCPHCGAYSRQEWEDLGPTDHSLGVPGLAYAQCDHCEKPSVWYEKRMVFPFGGGAPLPNPDLPDEIKVDYEEARAIAGVSPRGAAALLRLAVQKLCRHLGESGQNINGDIANLVKKGLDPRVQKALDIVRVIGNNAVHPGQIDLRDDPETAGQLFNLANLIAEVMITYPKQVNSVFDSLPEGAKTAIAKRDSGSRAGRSGH